MATETKSIPRPKGIVAELYGTSFEPLYLYRGRKYYDLSVHLVVSEKADPRLAAYVHTLAGLMIANVEGVFNVINNTQKTLLVGRRRLEHGHKLALNIGEDLYLKIAEHASMHREDPEMYRLSLRGPPLINGDNGDAFSAKYMLQKVIGRGSFGTVYTAHRSDEFRRGSTPVTYAVKKIVVRDHVQGIQTVREQAALKMADHPNIVKLHDSIGVAPDTIYLVMEYCPEGALDLYVQDNRLLDPSRIKHIMSQLFSGVCYLHSYDIAHRDLKPANILRTADWTIKIADLGLSKFLEPSDVLDTVCGTPAYAAPEVYDVRLATRGYGLNVDAWSLGVILAALSFGRYAWTCPGDQSTWRHDTVRTVWPLEGGEHRLCPHGLDLLRSCLKPSLERPECIDLATYPYFGQCCDGPCTQSAPLAAPCPQQPAVLLPANSNTAPTTGSFHGSQQVSTPSQHSFIMTPDQVPNDGWIRVPSDPPSSIAPPSVRASNPQAPGAAQPSEGDEPLQTTSLGLVIPGPQSSLSSEASSTSTLVGEEVPWWMRPGKGAQAAREARDRVFGRRFGGW
ncbi:kinase-like protein [Calocera cornea HHB12733]|uniref:Kinase-like protein n=1 Tax=Calocera cornea HHB12733 TaxID=1353952 RepID=A0A165K438_9BASI|nr:kinase-like protein [Calocera cornea HHB12733]